MKIAILTLAMFFAPILLAGQNAVLVNQKTSAPETTTTKLSEAPKIDGDVLNDAVWNTLTPIDALTQTQPNFGSAASEKTEIRIGFTETTFYLSAICFDSEPDKLIVSDARRDASLENMDAFLFILDTYHDRQNGFMFGTNSVGIEYDAQVDNEGQGNFNANRQQGGTVGGFNLNWDASWEVKTLVGDFGWSAEFAIPLRTIRYAAGENQSWGINFRRNIRKTNEIVYWSPLPVGFDLKRLSLAGSISGLDLVSPGNLKVIPYVLGQISRNHQVEDSKTEFTPEVGVDVKYSLTPAMTLDLTYNTDFAQVEVDEQQVNLDRFNLFFPEKRPFFLENAGLFSVGSPGEVDLFFSRRIGIGNGGQLVPIIGGARLSGKMNQTNVGLLSMFTDDVDEEGIDGNNFTVARVEHQLGNRTAIGGVFVNRQGMGEQEDNYNRTYAIDGRLGLGKQAQLSGFYARTATPGINEANQSFKFQGEYNWNNWELRAGYTEVGEGFNPETGFLLRSAFRKPEFLVLYHLRPKKDFMGILELRPHVSYRGYWNFDGFRETNFLHIDNHWEWKSGLEIHTGINFTSEGVVEPFQISEGVIIPAGTYDHAEAQIVFRTNKSNTIYFDTRSVLGGFFGGRRNANRVTIGVRAGDKFSSEFSLSHNDIRLSYGDFTTDVFGARLSYSFTPRIYIQSLIQYNSVADLWAFNARFGWLQRANTGLFLVYNENRSEMAIRGRSFTVKYSYMFDVLK
jgi:hypothetical protein